MFREPKDIIAEVQRLNEKGIRNIRLGGQTCIVSYKAEGEGDPRPNVDAVRQLFTGLKGLDLDVVHVDNANSSVISSYPAELGGKPLKSIFHFLLNSFEKLVRCHRPVDPILNEKVNRRAGNQEISLALFTLNPRSSMVKKAERMPYLDLAKGLAVLFMILQHSMLVHAPASGEGMTALGEIIVLLGTAPAAPVFMLIMGVLISKSSRGFRSTVDRGFRLLVAGYLLNLLRFVIPLSLVSTDGQELLSLFFVADIFQLAGLSYIISAFLKGLPHRNAILLLLCSVILLLSPYLWGLSDNMLTWALWGTDPETVYFPFFPWAVYPLLGMAIGGLFLSYDERAKVRLSIIAASACIILGILTLELFPIGDGYTRTGAAVHLLIIGFILLWMPLLHRTIVRFGKDGRMIGLLTYWGRNVTSIYMVQWIIFGWSVLLLDINAQTDAVALVIGVSVLVVTHYLSKTGLVRKAFSWI